jgi:outer membrane receptor protein involved in Fe transport
LHFLPILQISVDQNTGVVNVSAKKQVYRLLYAGGALMGAFLYRTPACSAEPTVTDASPLEEIVVTANKRKESIRTVAAAVGVVTGDNLIQQGKGQLSDYVADIPGVSINTLGSPGQSSITIRGIPPLTNGSKVATYIDEAPLGSSGIWAAQSTFQLDLLPFDLDRLELLRGPQGTLYGAGSMGGLLKYALLTPDTANFAIDAGIDVSSIKGAGKIGETVQARVNLPIKQDVLAVSLSGFRDYTPGYIENAYDGRSDVNSDTRYGGRVALVFTPVADLTIKLNALTQRVSSKDDATISFLNPEQVTQSDGSVLVRGGQMLGRHTEDKAFLAPFTSNVDFYSATVNWNPGSLEFVSASSWSHNHIVHVADNTISYGSYLPLFGLDPGLVRSTLELGLDKFTQEFRVATRSDAPVSGLAGVFYTDERATNNQFVSAFDSSYQPIDVLQPYAGFSHIPTKYREYAAFGDVYWKIGSQVELGAGVRYSDNEQRFDLTGSGALLSLPQSPPTVLPTVRSSDTNTTYMASAKYQFNEQVMMYARVSSGYAPGGANTPLPGAPASVDAEKSTSYEVGIRSQFFDRKATLDLTGYHISWNDIQLPAITDNVGFTENGGHAVSNGFELSSVISPVAHLNINVTAAYTQAELKSVNGNVATPFVLDTQLLLVPKWTLGLSPDYWWALGAWTAKVGGNIRWMDQQYGVEKIVSQPYFILPSATLVDLNASLTKGPLTLRAYIRNLTDRLAPTTGYLNTDVTGATRQTDLAITQPRTVGVGAIVKF